MVKKQLCILIVLSIFIIYLGFSGTLAAVQETFVLDLDSPLIKYNESYFNNSLLTMENVHNGSENITYWISIPKNSTVINVTFDVTGKIVPTYEKQIMSNGIIGMSIGNATNNIDNEISVGTQGNDGYVRLLYGVNGTWIWNSSISTNSQIFSTDIGNVTSDAGEEIAAGSANDSVYLLDSAGSVLWIKDTGGDVKSVKIADLYEDGGSEVIAGSDKIYVLNETGGENWSVSVTGCTSINEIAVGNVTNDNGNEIVVGCNGGKVFILNATGDVVNNVTIGASAINSVDIGNVTSDPGNEMTVGSSDSLVYVLNSTGDQVWNYSTGGSINSVRIGDVTTQYSGNEVVCGSNDQKVYTLDKDGGLIWYFGADSFINTISIGNLTIDPGNEVAAGAGNGYIYTFNFDYFPTNLSIDVGAVGGYDWNYSGKLRDTRTVYGITSAIQSFLDSCAEDVNGFCNVSLVFHSDYQGKLNVSLLNLTYYYNTSVVIQYQNVSAWSRTNNIDANESVGNAVRQISFVINPANDIDIQYIKVNSSATSCDFNNTNYTTTDIGSDRVCDVTDFTVPKSGALPLPTSLWDNNMTTGVPVYIGEATPVNTTGLDNYYWRKNFTLYNNTGFPSQLLTNVTGNTTLDDTVVKGSEYILVWYSGQSCDITPSSESSDCNTSSPTYYSSTCASLTFWACKKDTNSDGVYDYFDFRQGSFAQNTTYQVGGDRNINANLTSPAVAPASGIWGRYFNYSVYVDDPESDMVNVTLWINATGVWSSEGEVNTTSAGTVYFNLTSDNSWVGTSHYYRFEYQDFNTTDGNPIHSPDNTSVYSGPDVQMHNVSVLHSEGNESVVARGENITLAVRINDTNESTWIGASVPCRFWVTTNGTQFDSGHDNVTNSSGHCTYTFSPDSGYSTGNQTWKAGVRNGVYYLDVNSSSFLLSVRGRINVTFIIPQDGSMLRRNASNYFLARLYDEYGVAVNASGYNCSFYFNGTYINSSDTNATGWCNYTWSPACGVSIGRFNVTVNLSGSASELYTIWGSQDNKSINMTDDLNTTVTNPPDYTVYHKGDTVTLNSTTNDTCYMCSSGDFSMNWSKKWWRALRIYVNETSGINRTREPFILNGTQLEGLGIYLSDWAINYTVVVSDGEEVPADIKAWTDDSKTGLDESQTYMNNYSELIFLLDMQAYQSRTYWIYYNQSNLASDYNLSYILNGGFENNDTSSWQYLESSNCFVAGIDRCKGYAIDEGTETTGNHSIYLYSECTTVGCNTVEIEQNLTTQFRTSYLKISYKSWGEFNTGSGAYLSLEAGNVTYNLSVTPGTSYAAAQWNETTINNPSFQSAKNISIKIHDVLDSGGGMGASHVYVDYVCIANSTGDCVTLDSGSILRKTYISQTAIGSDDNITWNIPFSETQGKRRILANASGNYYNFGQDWADIIIYGWTEMSTGNISSDQCAYNQTLQTFKCMRNATLTMFCNVIDSNSTLAIEGYNVSFYGDDVYLGSNLTNSSGVSVWEWTNSTDVIGQHNITCNITDYGPLYYNSTPDDNVTVHFNVSSGNTTAEVLVIPLEENATNMTKNYNHTFPLNMIVNNTGNGTMYSVDVTISVPTGIEASSVSCPVLEIGSYCNVTSQVTVTYLAVPGNQTINITVDWSNADSTQGNVSNQTSVTVMNKTVLNIVEIWINYIISRGDSRNIGNFTVEAFGNTEITGINFSESGGNASDVTQWISYSPVNVSSILQGSDQGVLVNMTVPSNTTLGVYIVNITADATGSTCSPTSGCSDYVLLNLTVSVPDWDGTPSNMSKTVGLISDNGTIGSITIINNRATNYTFNVSISGNGTSYITSNISSFSLLASGSYVLNIYHNVSGIYPPGYWFVNITLTSLNNTFPTGLNISVFLNVINMTVSIVSPNQTNTTSAINASDTVNITANATLSGAPITSNMIWTVEIAGESCTGVQSSYNASTTLWDLNCTAPSLTGNPLNNTLTITGNYTVMSGTVVSDTQTGAVMYDDITPPQFSSVEVSSVNYNDNIPWILFSVTVTDNGNVSSVWANVTYDTTTVALTNYTESSGNYTFNFTNPNTVTDYDIIIFANDTMNGLQNSTTGWFDVYRPLQFTGSSLDPNSRNQTMNFTFYRSGTSYHIHHFGTNSSYGDYNQTVHKRDYDLLVDFQNQLIRFNVVNTTLSSEYQHNVSNPGNLTNPVRFDMFPNASSTDISNIDLPDTAENILMALVIESPYLNHTNKTIIIDYTAGLSGGTYQEGDLRIFYCTNWSFSGRSCGASQEFSHFNEGITPNVTANTFTFTVNSSSTAYAIAESCYPNTCGYTPPGGTPGGGPSSGGIPPSTSQPVCGNGACEIGENELNCPQDCLKYAFDVKTDIGDEIYLKMFPGENKTYQFTIVNRIDKAIITFLSLQGLREYITIEKEVVGLKAGGNETINIIVNLPEDIEPGVYRTVMSVTSEGKTKDVPITVEVSLGGRNLLSLDVDLLSSTVSLGGEVRFKVSLRNLGYKRTFDINMTYMVKEGDTGRIVNRQSEEINIEDVFTYTRALSLEGLELDPGQYFLEVWADFDEFSVKDVDGFELVEFSLVDLFFGVMPWIILALVLVTFGYFGRLRYIKWKLSRVRYPLPVKFDRIPGKTDRSFWLGNIADTNKTAWYNPDDLTTHILIAGSTGSGKSVGASIIVEEALSKGIPVIVFDPTAQWTGFVKACNDENVLSYYSKFRMDKRYTKPYKGMIFDIEDPHLDLDFKKYMNPDEITVFVMNKLKPGQYDVAIKNIIDSVFRIKWEESPELKMIVVFDEVHRLLEKYGGIGGYISLEKACREFRKWGIGVIMCSQVLADFKEAIAGNVLTDIQLNTKSLVDIGKVKEKYGPVYAQRVSRQGIGVGMIQHPKYNDGKPWFVNFRPPYHNPHKISNEDMIMYKDFASKLESIDAKVAAMKREGKDVFDIELEVKLAKDKLKQGRFRMAKIYIESLEKYFR